MGVNDAMEFLANKIVEDMDMDDIMQLAYDTIYERFENDYDSLIDAAVDYDIEVADE